MPASHSNVNSLCYFNVFVFILVVIVHKYDCNLDLKTIIKKTSMVGVYRLLVNFNNYSQYISIHFMGSCFKIFSCRYIYSSFYILWYHFQKNLLQINKFAIRISLHVAITIVRSNILECEIEQICNFFIYYFSTTLIVSLNT